MRRLIDVWVAVPKWWKAFYVAFPLALFVMLGAVSDSSFALLVSFVWASMIAFAIWASEKLKERLRGRDYFPDDRERRR